VLRKDRVRAVAKLTHTVDGRAAFLESPPLTVHLDATGHDMEEVEEMVDDHRSSLADERRFLLDRYRIVDVARRVVGVGTIGSSSR
jgi:Uncharacterized protein conserved in bacteria (DUF2252)